MKFDVIITVESLEDKELIESLSDKQIVKAVKDTIDIGCIVVSYQGKKYRKK